jgi:hypothetical protein
VYQTEQAIAGCRPFMPQTCCAEWGREFLLVKLMATDTTYRLSPNLGLLDANATGRTFAELRNTFLPVDFFDLCSMIEEMVLRDKIVLVGKYDKLRKPFRAALEPFVREKVFEICVDRVTIRKLATVPQDLLRASEHVHAAGMTSSSVIDADREVTRLLAAEIAFNVPTIPLLRHLHNYGFTRRPEVDHTVCDLSIRFRDIKQMAAKKLRFEASRRRYDAIALPPIALQVLQRARHFDELPNKIIEVRNDYRRLREASTQLAIELNDPTMRYDAYQQKVQVWKGRWQDTIENAMASDMGLGLTSIHLLRRGSEIVRSLSTGDLIGTALSTISLASDVRELSGNLLFRPVHYTVRNYMRRHHTMASTIGRLFELDPSLVHRQLSIIGSQESVWRSAMESLSRAA